jgi:thiol-disulfide isomerase/thioredoxin
MRHFIIAIAILLALLGGYFGLLNVGDSPRQITSEDAGKLVFAAAFPDTQGVTQPLAQWRGKVVVLNFWAPWCPPCLKEMPGFVELQRKYGERGLIFIGIALDTKENVQSYLRKNSINYPILLGQDDAVELSSAIGNARGGLPFSAVIDRQGNIVAAQVGMLKEEKLEKLITPLLPETQSSKAENHGREVHPARP